MSGVLAMLVNTDRRWRPLYRPGREKSSVMRPKRRPLVAVQLAVGDARAVLGPEDDYRRSSGWRGQSH